jgi:hypothetical protein
MVLSPGFLCTVSRCDAHPFLCRVISGGWGLGVGGSCKCTLQAPVTRGKELAGHSVNVISMLLAITAPPHPTPSHSKGTLIAHGLGLLTSRASFFGCG